MNVNRAANRLHHIGMLYVGALKELADGKAVGLIPAGAPGAHGVRDLISLVLLCRAEINALSNLLVQKGVFTVQELTAEVAEQYEWFAQQKAAAYGYKVMDGGLERG